MQRATLTQVRAGRGGQMYEIDADVLDICRRIQEIDKSLGVDFSEAGSYFRVYQQVNGAKHTVTTTTELTPEVIEVVRRIAQPGYDVGAEMDRLDDIADRERQRTLKEAAGEAGERLFHAVRKDVDAKDSISLPRGINDGA